MSWLSNLEGAWRLDEAVSQFNEALDVLERGGQEVDAARCLSDALNRIRAEWSLLQTTEELDDAEAFRAMLAQALGPEAQAELLGSAEVAELAGLEPGTSTGVIPAQFDLVNLLLDKPDERLVIYGTLAPGRANHYVIEGLRGQYCDCSVHGRISEVDGLPYFTWAPSEDSLGAQLLSSNQLPEKWGDLDRFEGDGYKRRLIPATTDGGLTVASIYLSTSDDSDH
jgi:gamma-glutamylcyclotransferase (GGCT)/AIG2-like uncharacterized protein YtfP